MGIKAVIIHALGGVTNEELAATVQTMAEQNKSEVEHVKAEVEQKKSELEDRIRVHKKQCLDSFYLGTVVPLQVLKAKAEQINGTDADSWCKVMYSAICNLLEKQQRKVDINDEWINEEEFEDNDEE